MAMVWARYEEEHENERGAVFRATPSTGHTSDEASTRTHIATRARGQGRSCWRLDEALLRHLGVAFGQDFVDAERLLKLREMGARQQQKSRPQACLPGTKCKMCACPAQNVCLPGTECAQHGPATYL